MKYSPDMKVGKRYIKGAGSFIVLVDLMGCCPTGCSSLSLSLRTSSTTRPRMLTCLFQSSTLKHLSRRIIFLNKKSNQEKNTFQALVIADPLYSFSQLAPREQFVDEEPVHRGWVCPVKPWYKAVDIVWKTRPCYFQVVSASSLSVNAQPQFFAIFFCVMSKKTHYKP